MRGMIEIKFTLAMPRQRRVTGIVQLRILMFIQMIQIAIFRIPIGNLTFLGPMILQIKTFSL
jgi:hypothetical protein